MTTIREKIKQARVLSHLADIPDYVSGFREGLYQGANIAEAEVQRLEDRVRELENELPLYKMDLRSGGTGS